MKLNSSIITNLSKIYGDAFYILHTKKFEQNVVELKKAFMNIYQKFNIAYSYKTNYIPKLCRIINRLGGYAEIVSDMELEIALRIGVLPNKIIWNGPYKNANKVQGLLLSGGIVNIDSIYEIEMISRVAKQNPNKKLKVGIRCNFDINDGVISRFGFDTKSDDFLKVLEFVKNTQNIYLIGMQCHFATRALETWSSRAKGMLKLLDELRIMPEHIDLGGGMYGKMANSLKEQFNSYIPTYTEYAETVASLFANRYGDLPYDKQPLLLVEPGSALVGDCMSFISKVVSVKSIRGKFIATLLGSIYNINPTLNTKNPPITVFNMGNEKKEYSDLDFGGFTCIESDYLYRHYKGFIAQNDMVMFDNVGSYSVVLKPPFILPNFPVLDIEGDDIEVIKKAENFDDLFHTYEF